MHSTTVVISRPVYPIVPIAKRTTHHVVRVRIIRKWLGRAGPFVVTLIGAAAFSACGGETPTGNGPAEQVGSVQVTTSTTGTDLDTDGYTVTVDSQSEAIGLNASVTFFDIPEGDAIVALSGMATNCTVA